MTDFRFLNKKNKYDVNRSDFEISHYQKAIYVWFCYLSVLKYKLNLNRCKLYDRFYNFYIKTKKTD